MAQKGFACVLVSAPGVEQGKSYTLKVGSNSIDVTLDGITYSNVSGSIGRPAGPSAGGSPTGGNGPSGGGSTGSGGSTAPTGTTNPPGGSQGNRGGDAKDGPGGTTPTSRG